MSGLAEVLAAHWEYCPDNDDVWRCAGCEAPLDGSDLDAAMHAHVADQITAHLAERLASPEVVEAVAEVALLAHLPMGDRCLCGWEPAGWFPGLTDAESQRAYRAHVATAALGAVRELLGGGR